MQYSSKTLFSIPYFTIIYPFSTLGTTTKTPWHHATLHLNVHIVATWRLDLLMVATIWRLVLKPPWCLHFVFLRRFLFLVKSVTRRVFPLFISYEVASHLKAVVEDRPVVRVVVRCRPLPPRPLPVHSYIQRTATEPSKCSSRYWTTAAVPMTSV